MVETLASTNMSMLTNNLGLQLLTAVLIGIGAGYLGAFMILRRMSLVGDALSHVALPGIAIALLLNINPFIGASFALVVAIIGVAVLERKTTLPSETLIGIFFTLSLALGLILTPQPDLLEALFGDITKVSNADLYLTAFSVLIMLLIIPRITKGLVLGVISKDLTRSLGIKINTINFIFLLLVSIVVALGLKVAGTLLMGSLVIIPAAAAKNLSNSLSSYSLWAMLFGAVSSLAGILLSLYIGFTPGPIIVLVSGVIFLITLFFKSENN